MKFIKASEILSAYIAADVPAFLWGDPGIGKSEMVAQLAHNAGAGFIDYRLSTLETVDLRGLPHIVDREVVWALPDLFSQIMAFPPDQIVYLFFDEMNIVSPSMMAAAMQLVLDRRIGPHKLPSNVRIIGAGNVTGIVQKMPPALRARFAHIDVEPDAEEWRKWGDKTGRIEPLVSAFIHIRPELLFDDGQRAPGDMRPVYNRDARESVNPRNWEKVSKFVNMPADMRRPLVTGIIGQFAEGQLDAFVRLYQGRVSPEQIIADPYGAPLPALSEPALMSALCVALARYSKPGNFQAITTYLDRLPKDFSVMAVREATTRAPELQETQAFGRWVEKNQDVVI